MRWRPLGDHERPSEPFGSKGRRLALAGLLALAACQTPALPLSEADIPAGRTLVRDGLAGGGAALVTLDDAAAGCRAPELWRREGEAWREAARGGGLAGCPSVTARLSPGGDALAVYDYGAGKARLLRVDADGFRAASETGFTGRPGFTAPPPGPNLSLVGDRLLLGAVNRDCRMRAEGGGIVCGTAVLLVRRGRGWEEVARFRPPAEDEGQVRFGQAVALLPGGDAALVGGTGEPGRDGALWLFRVRPGEPPAAVQKLAPERRDGWFGNDVALAADGSWLAVGGEQAVYLYEREGAGFAFRKRLTAPDLDAGHFGETVALSAAGDRLVVGAPRSRCGLDERCGAVYLYDRDGPYWDLSRMIRPATNRADTDFGHHLALSPDGRHLAAQGAVLHVFTLGRAGGS
jgi:hypothetical protein